MRLKECMQIVSRDSIMIDKSTNSCSRLHSHPFFELVYVLSGHAIHHLDNTTMVLEPGDYFLIDLNNVHGYNACSGSGEFAIVNCMFMPDFIDPILKNAVDFRSMINKYPTPFSYCTFDKDPTQRVYHDDSGQLSSLVLMMHQEYLQKKPGYLDIIRNCLVNAILLLARNETSRLADNTRDVTKIVRAYVIRHYNEPLQLSDICQNVNCSLSQISKLFKRDTGTTFHQYLKSVRIARSCHLLKTTEKSIDEISGLVGYSDPSYFYRVFREETGLTPQQYRRNEKNAAHSQAEKEVLPDEEPAEQETP